MIRKKIPSIFFSSCLGFVGACGGGGEANLEEQFPATQVGQAIFSTKHLSITLENKGGGFVPRPPDGSACGYSTGKYVFEVASKKLIFTRCDSAGAGVPYTISSGTKVLSTMEYQTLVGVLEKLRVVKSDRCGADKPRESLTVVTRTGIQEYGDAFYGCMIKDRPLLDSGELSGAISTARELSQAK